MVSSARSRASSHVWSVAGTSSPFLRTRTSGPGWRVAALTVLKDVISVVCSASENATKAEPTDGWPASSSVVTNHTDGVAASRSCLSVSPLAAIRWSGSSSLRIVCLASSASCLTISRAASTSSWKEST